MPLFTSQHVEAHRLTGEALIAVQPSEKALEKNVFRSDEEKRGSQKVFVFFFLSLFAYTLDVSTILYAPSINYSN